MEWLRGKTQREALKTGSAAVFHRRCAPCLDLIKHIIHHDPADLVVIKEKQQGGAQTCGTGAVPEKILLLGGVEVPVVPLLQLRIQVANPGLRLLGGGGQGGGEGSARRRRVGHREHLHFARNSNL